MSLIASLLLSLLMPGVLDSLRAVGDRCEDAYLAGRPELMLPEMKEQERLIALMPDSDSRAYAMGHLEKLWGSYWFCLSDEDPSRLDEALTHYRKAKELYPPGLDISPRALHTLGMEMAQLYYRRGQYGEALEELSPLVNNSFSREMTQEALGPYALCLARLGRFPAARRAIGRLAAGNPEVIRKKAKILSLEAEAAGGKSAEALALYKDYFQTIRSDWTRQFGAMQEAEREAFWMRVRPFAVDCLRLEDADPGFLYDVVLFTRDLMFRLRSESAPAFPDWRQVRAALKKGEAALEFVQYEIDGRTSLGGLVLRKDAQPRFIPLGPVEAMTGLRLDSGVTLGEMLDSGDPDLVDEAYADPRIGALVWSPALRDAIGDCKDLYFAPDGFLHVFAAEYCWPGTERTALHRISGTRSLLSRKAGWSNRKNALLVGGVDFDADPDTEPVGNDGTAYRMLAGGKGFFEPLENTVKEVETISGLLQGFSRILEGEEANETAFREICGTYSLIHIATHGNFSASGGFIGDDLSSSRRDFALSRSVLLLAGGNRNLHDPFFDPSGTPDGLLSAREVSRLRTLPADLVVLSACQSGKGVVTPDGISGMLDAWKMAGAGTLVSSLWNVDDEATAYFMRCFYEALSGGKPVKAAFDEARRRMLEPVEKTVLRFDRRRMRNVQETVWKDWSAPRFRNAFILTDDV